MASVYSAGDFRNGTTFEMDGNVYRIVEFQHVKPGKGSAFVRTKIKNVITGSVLEKTFNPSEKFPAAEIEKKEMQYLLEVTYTEPGFAGNTTTTSGKPATLENGLEISVPMFINIGDVIRVDTRTGEYMERV